MPTDIPGCPWEQCEHSYNAHTRDHCMACECEKPPPPLPAPADRPLTIDEFNAGEPQELEIVQADTCRICSAFVDDREKHVTWHERMTDTLTNLVMSLGALERRSCTEKDKS